MEVEDKRFEGFEGSVCQNSIMIWGGVGLVALGRGTEWRDESERPSRVS